MARRTKKVATVSTSLSWEDRYPTTYLYEPSAAFLRLQKVFGAPPRESAKSNGKSGTSKNTQETEPQVI